MVVIFLILMSVSSFAVKISVWQVGFANETANIIKDLIAEDFTPRTGIEVEFSNYAWEGMFNKVLLAMASNDTPDIIAGAPDHLVEYGVRGGVIDLKDIAGEERVRAVEKNLYPGTTRALNFRGNTFGFVQSTGVIIGYYRTDILADLGMAKPETWNDLHEILPKLQAKNMNAGWGYGGIGSVPQYGSYMTIKQAGGNWVDGNNFKSELMNPESIQGFSNYVELFTKHGMPKEGGVSFQMFRTGEWPVLLDISAFYANTYLGAPEITGKWEVGLVPGTVHADSTVSHESFMGGTVLGIPQYSQYKKEAFLFLEWLLSDEVQSQFVAQIPERIPGSMLFSGNMQATMSLPIPQEDKETFYNQLNVSNPFSYFPGGAAVTRELEFAVHNVLQMGMTPPQALEVAHKSTESELSRKQKEYSRYIENITK